MAVEALPAVDAAIDRAVDGLKSALGDALVAVSVYGGVAKGRYTPGISDINVLVLVRDARLDVLEKAAPVLTAARRQDRIEALVLTPDDLHGFARWFPAKILDIQAAHRDVHGASGLASIRVDTAVVRHRIAQELGNLRARLRQRVVERGAEPGVLWRGLVQSLPSLAVQLEVLLRLLGVSPPSDRAGVLRAAMAAIRFDGVNLEPFAELHREDTPPADAVIRTLYDGYLGTVGALTQYVETRAEK